MITPEMLGLGRIAIESDFVADNHRTHGIDDVISAAVISQIELVRDMHNANSGKEAYSEMADEVCEAFDYVMNYFDKNN